MSEPAADPKLPRFAHNDGEPMPETGAAFIAKQALAGAATEKGTAVPEIRTAIAGEHRLRQAARALTEDAEAMGAYDPAAVLNAADSMGDAEVHSKRTADEMSSNPLGVRLREQAAGWEDLAPNLSESKALVALLREAADSADSADYWRDLWQKASNAYMAAEAERDRLRAALVQIRDSGNWVHPLGAALVRIALEAVGPAGAADETDARRAARALTEDREDLE